MKDLMLQITNLLGLAYWVEIITDNPKCTYYFGPFFSRGEAEAAQGGYIEDLQNEGAQGISVAIKRHKPDDLTIFEEAEEREKFEGMPSFSGQIS